MYMFMYIQVTFVIECFVTLLFHYEQRQEHCQWSHRYALSMDWFMKQWMAREMSLAC
jgi:hypothetical protein